MRRGFTLVEVMVVISLIFLVAALSYPALREAKKSALKSTCISNMRQIGSAIALYREALEGADQGSPEAMGLPPNLLSLDFDSSQIRCLGNNPEGNGYYKNYPSIIPSDWPKYTASMGTASIIYFDPSHQSSFPRSVQWDTWTAIGLRLDTSVFSRTRRGFPLYLAWWHR